MTDQPGSRRLDPETLAAYIDGLLPPEARAKVEAEIAADPDTYEWVVHSIGAVEDDAVGTPQAPMRAASPPTPARRLLPFYRRRGVRAVIGTLIAAAAAVVLVVRVQPAWWQGLWGPSVDPRLATLVQAVGEQRYIEARLTGGFRYGPLAEVTRGPLPQARGNLTLVEVAAELQRAAAEAPSPPRLHAWGVAQLLLGDASSASATLERALELRWSGDVASDLAAAYLAAGDARGAVARIEQLQRRDDAVPTPELAFNYALALERANQRQAATEAWKRVRDLESDPGWRAEAERHLARLEAAAR